MLRTAGRLVDSGYYDEMEHTALTLAGDQATS